jgi:hypothetical protein
MRLLMVAAALALAGCAGAPDGVKPDFAGGSRRDGIVTMASTGTLFNPVGPDWRAAAADAGQRCRAWGYGGAGEFAGWQEACRAYDLHGRCTTTVVTRFYPCIG